MAMGFKTPEMNWDTADLRDELAKFKQYSDLIFSGPYSRKTDKEQASFILLWIGRQGLETYNSWTWDTAEDRNKPSTIWEQFKQHVAPKVNHSLAQYQLQQLKQKIDESVIISTGCLNQASKCRFKPGFHMIATIAAQRSQRSQHNDRRDRKISISAIVAI